MKKLMILGASRSQLPLIRAAKRLGMETVVCSTPGNWPGLMEADLPLNVDISDPEAVLMEAQRLGIDGITTCCMDTGVKAVGKVCSAMKLTGISEEAACTARDKYRMKDAFRKHGVRTAEFAVVKKEEELSEAMERLSFPLVVKAVDLMGSRGIYLCEDRESCRNAFREAMEATGKDYVLVERFLKGILFDAEAMVVRGELAFCMLDNSELIQCHVPTSIGHSIPFSLEKEAGADAREQVEKAVKALGIDNMAVDLDLMYCGGKVYVIEINPRAGASCLPELVGCRYGIDYYEILARLATGEDVRPFFLNPDPDMAALSRLLFSPEDGTVSSIRIPSRFDGPLYENAGLVDLSFDIQQGSCVRRYTNGRDRIGQIIIRGNSLKACEMLLEDLLGEIRLELVRDAKRELPEV